MRRKSVKCNSHDDQTQNNKIRLFIISLLGSTLIICPYIITGEGFGFGQQQKLTTATTTKPIIMIAHLFYSLQGH